MKLAAALKLAEDAFGYPLLGNAAVERALKDRLADVEPDDMEQDLVDFILTPNIVWAVDGPERLRSLADKEETQKSSILAFHLLGWFAVEGNPFFAGRHEEYLRVDLAPAHELRVFIAGGRFEPYAGPVFSSPEQATRATEMLWALKNGRWWTAQPMSGRASRRPRRFSRSTSRS